MFSAEDNGGISRHGCDIYVSGDARSNPAQDAASDLTGTVSAGPAATASSSKFGGEAPSHTRVAVDHLRTDK